MSESVSIAGNIIEFKFTQSAYKHGITQQGILKALNHSIYDETLVEIPNKTLFVGYDEKARLIEVICDVVSENVVVVYHAMPCRKQYRERILGK
jgi:sulfur transfer complex TusBCD TusB component (DsrH family)